MPRKPRSRALVPVTPTTTHRFGSEEVANVAIYRVPDRHRSEPGAAGLRNSFRFRPRSCWRPRELHDAPPTLRTDQ